MSSIGFPDWGFSYNYPVDPAKCVVFSQARHDGAIGSTNIYTLAAGEVVVVAAMAVGVNLSVIGNGYPLSAIECTTGIDGAGGVQQLIIAQLASHSIALGNVDMTSNVESELNAPIAIAGGAAGNTIRWTYDLNGTTTCLGFVNTILYKTT